MIDLAYGVLLSIIASIIFYYALVYKPELTQKKHLKEFFGKRSWNIVGDAHAIYTEIAKIADITTPFSDSTKTDIEQMCNSISLDGIAPIIIKMNPQQSGNWCTFLIYRKRRSDNFLEKLLKYITYLDINHIKHLTNISDCSYFTAIEMMLSTIGTQPHPDGKTQNIDNSFLSNEMYEYFTFVKELENYLKEEGFFYGNSK